MLSVSDIVVDYCLRKPQSTYTVYLECHRVCPTEKTSFFSSRPNWDSPTPSHGRGCTSTPFGSGGGHICLRERGVGVPIRTRGHILWYSRYIYTLWSLTSSKLGPLTPSSQASVSPPGIKGETHSPAGESGGGGVPIQPTGEKAWHSFYSVEKTVTLYF
jgi:hypothetical protein